MRITTTCSTSDGIRIPRGSTRRSPSRATSIATATGTGRRAIRFVTYAGRLEAEGIIAHGDLDRFKHEAQAIVAAEARAIVDAPWPEPATWPASACSPTRRRASTSRVLDPDVRLASTAAVDRWPLEPGPPFDPKGRTFLEAICLGVGDALRADPRVFVYGEDVGGKYGNAFLLLKPLLKEFGDRILNSPLAEGGVLGVCVGAALGGQRPIGEMQFNDFVATGFNQLVNNAAKIRYRWGGRRADGRAHAVRRPAPRRAVSLAEHGGLVLPDAGPEDRGAVDAVTTRGRSWRRPSPIRIRCCSTSTSRSTATRASGRRCRTAPPAPMPIGRAALRRDGADLAIVSYGAYVHVALRVADRLAADGVQASVLDLRSLAPLDRDALLACARHCHRVLIVHEDTRTGGIGESLAAIIQEEAFESLDAPIRIVGALDTPVPYSPPLEEFFLPSDAQIERAARLLVKY